jgi:hypothetical protein
VLLHESGCAAEQYRARTHARILQPSEACWAASGRDANSTVEYRLALTCSNLCSTPIGSLAHVHDAASPAQLAMVPASAALSASA